jgi:hypothetical protein
METESLAPKGLSREEILTALREARPVGIREPVLAKNNHRELARCRTWSNAVYWLGYRLHNAEGPGAVARFMDDAQK